MTKSAEENFIKYAKAHGVGIIEGDPEITNLYYERVVSAIKELRRYPDRGEKFLAELLHESDLIVVRAAATYLLPLRAREAEEALQKVAEMAPPLIAFGAEMTLREWRAGRLKID